MMKYYNPYEFAARSLYNRLRSDLTLESFISRRKLKNHHNKYVGKKAIILCNGPSLLDVDFDLLDGVYTFGLNKINLLFNKKEFRPSSIVSVNPHVIEQNKQFFNSTDIPLFMDSRSKKHISNKNSIFIHSSSERIFSETPYISFYQGFTVTFVAMQLAYYFGFKEIALVGCDHSFATKGKANKEVVSGDSDPNHFDKNYFAGGVKWQLPDLFQSEVSYQMAKDIFEENGRSIFNCTTGGELEVYKRRSLKEFIDSK